MKVDVSERVGVLDVDGVQVTVADSQITVNGQLDTYLAEVEWPSQYDDKADTYLNRLTPIVVELEAKGFEPQVQRHPGGLSLTACKTLAPAVARAA